MLLFASLLASLTFVSLIWLMCCAVYVYLHMDIGAIAALTPAEVSIMMLTAIGPVLLLWLVFAGIVNAIFLSRSSRMQQFLLFQIRKQGEKMDTLTATIADIERQNYRGVMLRNLGIGARNLNLLIADIMLRVNMLSRTERTAIFDRISKGEEYALCNALLEAAAVASFRDNIARGIDNDKSFGNLVKLYCDQFLRILTLYEKYDVENISMFGDGGFGRVYDLFKSLSPKEDVVEQLPFKFREEMMDPDDFDARPLPEHLLKAVGDE